MDYTAHAFENETITLDENSFVDCTFIGCRVVYRGGRFHIGGDTRMDPSTKFRFEGGAADTARLLLFLIKGLGVSFGDRFEVEAPGG